MRGGPDNEAGGRRRVGAAVAVALAACLAVPVAIPGGASADEGDGLVAIGTLPALESADSIDPGPALMVVDEEASLGLAFGGRRDASGQLGGALTLFDLQRLTAVTEISNANIQLNPNSLSYVLDTKRKRLLIARYPPWEPGSALLPQDEAKVNPCTPPLRTQRIFAVDYTAEAGRWAFRLPGNLGFIGMPCSGPHRFGMIAGSYDPVSDRMYLAGTYGTEGWRSLPDSQQMGPLREDQGQALLIRQMHTDDAQPAVSSLVADWEVDLRLAGCGRRRTMIDGDGNLLPFVARAGDDVLTYCWDPRPWRYGPVGPQGYVVRIPLGPDGKPKTVGGQAPQLDPVTGQLLNYQYRKTPTLPGDVTPIADPVTGKLFLVTSDAVNGNAVWVFDPAEERFVGVVTGGFAGQKAGNTAVGFDKETGRVYLLTEQGVLVVPTRATPLPGGLLYPVAVNEARRENFVTGPRLAVAPALHRLFVPAKGPRQPGTYPFQYRVIADQSPVEDPPEPEDPDRLTTQRDEVEGATEVNTSGAAVASGAHLVATGGAARAVDQLDPGCQTRVPGDQGRDVVIEAEVLLFGECAADVVVSPGHRDVALAATEIEVGSETGATAFATGLAFGSSDAASDRDVRRVGECGAETPNQVDEWGRSDRVGRGPLLDGSGTQQGVNDGIRQFQEGMGPHRDRFWNGWKAQRDQFGAGYREACSRPQAESGARGGPDARGGVAGTDGRGFPVRGAQCGDYGSGPVRHAEPAQPTSGAERLAPATVGCDAGQSGADAGASGGGIVLPDAGNPAVSVRATSSSVRSLRSAEGRITVAVGRASGVVIGPLSIAEVRSLAFTRAKGRTGTTESSFLRLWCGITVEGAAGSVPGCMNPDDPANAATVQALLDGVNQTLQRARVTLTPALVQATPGGYQAVATKDPRVRAADAAVNDDDSITVPGIQVLYYNDGAQGRSRLVLQLANVHAESRYGIVELPDFSSGDFGGDPAVAPPDEEPVAGHGVPPAPADGPAPGTPGGADETLLPDTFVDGDEPAVFEAVRTNAAQPVPVIARRQPGDPATRLVRVPVQILRDGIRLLVQHPREFGLLLGMWALLAAPVYLGMRRRAFSRAVSLA